MIDFAARLAELDALGLRRRRRVLDSAQGAHVRVDGKDYLSFASNDYLGLAAHPAIAEAACAALRDFGTGTGAAHLLTGHHILHHQAEQALAAFVGQPAALLFSTGYMANLGVVTALLDRHGAIFADKLNHASLVDAAQLSRAAHQRYRHNDLEHLEQLLRASDAEHKLIATDAVFSMDGDLAPVPELLALAEKYDAWLYVDDAHGFGVLGHDGRGVLEHFALPHSPRLIYLATLGKAAGVAGAFVAGTKDLAEWLVNKARTYIFTTAQPPALAAAVSASLGLIAGEPERRERLATLIARLKAGVATLPWPLMASETPIQPLLIGDNHATLRLSDGLRERGILLPAIRPPTVPEGSARLRISLSANHTEADIDRLLMALRELA
ncbi:MAG: 8-amino-7-oxononanoate synthase [Parasulfuritortus sp.]|nr:8-amino-7-oxononanoate synthase [Parasulfuritortus sp.]